MRWLQRTMPPAMPFRPAPDEPLQGASMPYSAAQIGLWTFMAVVCTLFLLFGMAYLMRITHADWRLMPPVPPQLWVSTALLAGASAAWQAAELRSRRARWRSARQAAVLGMLLALGFLASQLSAWQALARAGHGVTMHPGSSFFYMLSAVHGLHLLGGLAAGAWALRRASVQALALCAQYWHLLLALWLYLFLLLFAVTPQMVLDLCRSVGIPVR